MFSRRSPLNSSQKLHQMLWPSMGWKRALKYAQLRLIRIKDSTHSIATGFAFGASISFTPLLGMHIFLAAGLSWLTRGNILSSVGGTLLGNPWTFPLMWWASYKMGNWAFSMFDANISAMPQKLTWDYLVNEVTNRPMDLVIPWVIGGIIMMVFSWPIFYILTYRMVAKLRRKHKRLSHR